MTKAGLDQWVTQAPYRLVSRAYEETEMVLHREPDIRRCLPHLTEAFAHLQEEEKQLREAITSSEQLDMVEAAVPTAVSPRGNLLAQLPEGDEGTYP
jgi:hypothetical protein